MFPAALKGCLDIADVAGIAKYNSASL